MKIAGFTRFKNPALLSYGMAVLAVATVYSLVICDEGHFIPPAPVFLCLTMLFSLFGGYRTGMITAVISIVLFDFFFTTPVYSLKVAPGESVHLLLFSLTTIFACSLTSIQKKAVWTVRRTRDELANAVLKLESANAALQRINMEQAGIHERLRYSEAFLMEGQKISHTGSWRWNFLSGLITWSDEHYRIFGYLPECKTDPTNIFRTRLHKEDIAYLHEIAQNAMRRHERFECEYRIITESGDIRHMRGVGCPVKNGLDEVTEYIGVTVDITAQRNAEALLRKSAQEFRTLAENSPEGVVRYDLDCQRIFVNPAHLRNLGISAGEALNRPLESRWESDIPVETYRNLLREVMATGRPMRTFGIWNSPDKPRMHCEIQAVAERDAAGKVISVLALIRDVTALKETESQLKESQRLLRQLADRNEAVREEERKHLARELHDDLAQYLLALRMKISLLNLEFGQTHPELAVRSSDMIDLVDANMKVVRNVVTALRPPVLDIGIVSALEWLVDDFKAQKGIACRLRHSSDMLSLDERSATAIFRIAQESLRNVARHAGADQVDVVFENKGDCCLLQIDDNGKGFDPAALTAAKKSFGLIGIQERVLMLEGKVHIISAPGQGTRIQVFIPAVVAEVTS